MLGAAGLGVLSQPAGLAVRHLVSCSCQAGVTGCLQQSLTPRFVLSAVPLAQRTCPCGPGACVGTCSRGLGGSSGPTCQGLSGEGAAAASAAAAGDGD